jgi:hypothetical protein
MRKVLPATAENVYRRFIEFEERAATIYFRFASRFSENPQLSSFWFDMAMEEKQHAGLLLFCVCDSLFAHDLPKDAEIRKLAALLQKIERLSEAPNLTLEEAFSLAIEIESSEVNTIRSLGVDIFNTFHFAGTFKDCLFDVGVAHRLHFL